MLCCWRIGSKRAPQFARWDHATNLQEFQMFTRMTMLVNWSDKQIYVELSKKAHGHLEWAFIRITAF